MLRVFVHIKLIKEVFQMSSTVCTRVGEGREVLVYAGG